MLEELLLPSPTYSNGSRLIESKKGRLQTSIEKREVTIHLPEFTRPPGLQLSPESLQEIWAYCNRSYDANYHSNGQNPFHLHTMNFLLAHWLEVISAMRAEEHPHDSYQCTDPFRFPEVCIPIEGKEFRPDCIGCDTRGDIWVIEIGTHGKIPQLRDSLQAVQQIVPSVRNNLHGAVAYYKFQNRETGSIRFEVI